MNCPSRTDEPEGDGFNQNPTDLAADLTMREDLNGRANTRVVWETLNEGEKQKDNCPEIYSAKENDAELRLNGSGSGRRGGSGSGNGNRGGSGRLKRIRKINPILIKHGKRREYSGMVSKYVAIIVAKMKRYLKFVGPGFMISVAYIDPGNYSTGIVAGATYRYKLLFAILMSNIFAIFLQSLCIKLGSVSGLNLAEACREFLPRWLNYFLYVLAELAIIATDIAEVIGTAIAINLLMPKIPLVVGCALSIIDVLLLLLLYNPNGSMKSLRAFEFFVTTLVLGVVVCFCLQLSLIKDTSVSELFRGFLPSREIAQSQGLYQACGILGATVMPHSLYLGSGIVQPRLKEYDSQNGILIESMSSGCESDEPYQPSYRAIKACIKLFIIELTISLAVFALFVNSAILITAGASLYGTPVGDADLFGIHRLLSSTLSPAAGTIFALALLLSGVSAGIVGTITGQMVSEGALRWTIRPWLRRLITRSISIMPSIVIAAAVGKQGLNDVLNASQVVLSVTLPFITAPLILFTCRDRYMTVPVPQCYQDDVTEETEPNTPLEIKMGNNWLTATIAIVIWVIIAVMNVANLVLLGKGV